MARIQNIGGRSQVATRTLRERMPSAIPATVTIPPHPNLILHLKGTVGITDTGGAVDTWADQGSYGNDAGGSGTARPTTGTRTVNGLNVVDFDGTNDTLTGTIADIPAHHDGSGESRLTVYFAGVVDAVASNVVWLSLNGGAYFLQWRTGPITRISGDAQVDTGFGTPPIASAFFLRAVLAGSGDPGSPNAASVYVNGSTVVTGSTGRQPPWGAYALGATANMAIAEIQVYDDLLDGTTDAAIRADFTSTWGVTT